MNQLFDKYYEHPVDRVHDLGSTSVYHRREPALGRNEGLHSAVPAALSPEEESNSSALDLRPNHTKHLERIKKNLNSKWKNVLRQKFSFVYLIVGAFSMFMMLGYFHNFSKSTHDTINLVVEDNKNTSLRSTHLCMNLDNSEVTFLADNSGANNLEYVCVSGAPSYTQDYCINFNSCKVNINYDDDVTFESLSIACKESSDTTKCQVNMKSIAHGQTLKLNGNHINLIALSLKFNSIYFSSESGTFKVQDVQSNHSEISTITGDIVIQSELITKIASIQSETKLACITAAQAAKIQAGDLQSITSINEYFTQTASCSSSAASSAKAVIPLKSLHHSHSPTSAKQETNSHCYQLSDILLSTDSITDASSFKQTLSITNLQGNTYVNILQLNTDDDDDEPVALHRPLSNDVYTNSKPQMSKESRQFLMKTLDIKNSKQMIKTIIKLKLQGQHSQLFAPKDEINISFNKQYGMIQPSLVSTLSFNLIKFNVITKNIVVSPSICPYYLVPNSEQQPSSQVSEAIAHEIQTIVNDLNIHTASILVNGVPNDAETAADRSLLKTLMVVMVITCLATSAALSYLAYQQFEVVRFTLRRKAYEMWVFISLNMLQSARSFVNGADLYIQSQRQMLSASAVASHQNNKLVIQQRSEIYTVFSHVISMLQSFIKAERSSIESFCEILFAEQKYRNEAQHYSPTQLEFCDELPFEKFREYYTVYCYAMHCAEEVIDTSTGFLRLLEKYQYSLDGQFVRASSQSGGKFCIYRGLMESFIAAICVDPLKFNMEKILEPVQTESLIIYREYLVGKSVKLGKINAFSIPENIVYYAFVILQLLMPFLMCVPMVYAQWSYSYAEYMEKHYGEDSSSMSWQDQFDFTGFPKTVFYLTSSFVVVCGMDTVFHFTKPRLDRNNMYLRDCYVERVEQASKEKQTIEITSDNCLEVMRFKQMNQSAFQIMLWTLLFFNLFFFLLTSLALAFASFFYLEQGLLLAIFLLILIAVLIARYQSMKQTHENAREVLSKTWVRLINCDIAYSYGMAKQMSNQSFGNFLRDKNMDDRFCLRNRIIACVKADKHCSQNEKSYQILDELVNLEEGEFKKALKYMEVRGVSLCLRFLRISQADIVRELAVQVCIQFGVFLLCAVIIEYFNLCRNGLLQLLCAFVTILVAVVIFTVLNRKFSYINPETLEDSVNYVSKIISRSGLTFFTQRKHANYVELENQSRVVPFNEALR